MPYAEATAARLTPPGDVRSIRVLREGLVRTRPYAQGALASEGLPRYHASPERVASRSPFRDAIQARQAMAYAGPRPKTSTVIPRTLRMRAADRPGMEVWKENPNGSNQ
jgi:hypothetical protein